MSKWWEAGSGLRQTGVQTLNAINRALWFFWVNSGCLRKENVLEREHTSPLKKHWKETFLNGLIDLPSGARLQEKMDRLMDGTYFHYHHPMTTHQPNTFFGISLIIAKKKVCISATLSMSEFALTQASLKHMHKSQQKSITVNGVKVSVHIIRDPAYFLRKWLMKKFTSRHALGHGISVWISEVLKMSVRNPVSWSAHALSTHPGMSLGPAAFRVFTLVRVLLTSAVSRLSGCSSGRGTDFLTGVVLSASNLLKWLFISLRNVMLLLQGGGVVL